MTKIIIIMPFMIILIVASVLAVGGWFQEGNADLTLPGGNGNILFASNIGNQVSQDDIDYQRCTINPSLFTPIINDFDGDGFNDIVISRSTGIEVYSTNCDLVWKIDTVSAIAAMPVLMNIDSDEHQEIVFPLTQHLYAYEYNGADFVLSSNISTADLPYSIDYMGCSRDIHTCVVFDAGSTDIALINWTSQTATLNSNQMNNSVAVYQGYSGLSFSDTFQQTDIYTSFCYMEEQGSGLGHSTCQLIDAAGLDTGTDFIIDWTAQSWGANRFNYMSSNIVKIGSVYRIVSQAWLDTATDGWGISVNDLSGTELFFRSETDNDIRYGTVMVGDYDKDGSNEFCTPVTTGLSNPGFILNCYDDSFTLELSHLFLVANTTPGMVMGDFLPDHAFLGIATYEGIWYINETNTSHGILEYDSGKHYVQANNPGSMAVVASSGTSPMYVYTDDDEGFIVRDTFVGLSCGDGICQNFENDFNCPVDCVIRGAEECITDADCAVLSSQYPYCIDNLCIASDNLNQTCTKDTDCDFTNPFCYSGICIKGWFSGVPITNATAAQQQVDDAFDSTIGIIFGTSTLLKFLISIALIIGIMITVAQKTSSSVVIGLSGLMMTIFVTVAGLMPIYVLILIVISSIGFVAMKTFVPTGGG